LKALNQEIKSLRKGLSASKSKNRVLIEEKTLLVIWEEVGIFFLDDKRKERLEFNKKD